MKCNLSLDFCETDQSFTCHCGITGLKQTPNQDQYKHLTQKKYFFPLLLEGIEPTSFYHEPSIPPTEQPYFIYPDYNYKDILSVVCKRTYKFSVNLKCFSFYEYFQLFATVQFPLLSFFFLLVTVKSLVTVVFCQSRPSLFFFFPPPSIFSHRLAKGSYTLIITSLEKTGWRRITLAILMLTKGKILLV